MSHLTTSYRAYRYVLGLFGLVLGVVYLTHIFSSPPNFTNPATVAASIQGELQLRLSDPSSPFYQPGVTVTSVVCTKSGTGTDYCVDKLSNGQTVSETAVISADGNSYTTK